MLHPQTTAHISGLTDSELLEYILTGKRMYEPEAIVFAQAELDRRKLSREQLAALRVPILAKIAHHDAHTSIDDVAHASTAILCQGCGFEVPTAYVEYRQNIGALVLRVSQRYKGYLCQRCNRKIFWKATLITACFGWWGLISLFVAPVYLLGNLVTYLRTRSLPQVPPDAGPPRYDDTVIAMVSPHIQTIPDRLTAGDDVADICRAIAPKAGITAGQLWRFIQDVLYPHGTTKTPDSPIAQGEELGL